MTRKERVIQQRLLSCKILWYASGVTALFGMIYFLIIPAIGKFALLLTLYELAAEKEMLIVWYTYFVVLALIVLLDILVVIALGEIFFGRMKEAAFESIEKLLRGKGLSLSQ